MIVQRGEAGAAFGTAVGLANVNSGDRDTRAEELRKHPRFFRTRKSGQGRRVPNPRRGAVRRGLAGQNQERVEPISVEYFSGNWQSLFHWRVRKSSPLRPADKISANRQVSILCPT